MTDQLFLIECDLDNSLCIVDENDLMCDSEAVKISDNVQFFYKKKVCLGIVKSISCKNFFYLYCMHNIDNK